MNDLEEFFSNRKLHRPIAHSEVDSSGLSAKRGNSKGATPESALTSLRKAYSRNSLSLFLGAGISIEHGIPSWARLLQGGLTHCLLESHKDAAVLTKLYTDIFDSGGPSVARQIKLLLGEKREKGKLLSTINKILYDKIAFKQDSDFYREIANLCAGVRGRKAIKAVITYNYDDLIEQYLNRLKIRIPYRSYHSHPKYPISSEELPIFHVHGFLPQNGVKGSNSIVLSEDEYFHLFNNPYHWANQIQLRHLQESDCLFIGLSMTDINLRRLMELSEISSKKKKRHLCILRQPSLEDLSDQHVWKEFSTVEIEEASNALITLNKSLVSTELLSLGCRVIFIKEFDEIPNLLNKIYN